jgi:hypothetical protein
MKIEYRFYGGVTEGAAHKKAERIVSSLLKKGMKSEIKEVVNVEDTYYDFWLFIEGEGKIIHKFIRSLADEKDEINHQFNSKKLKIIVP